MTTTTMTRPAPAISPPVPVQPSAAPVTWSERELAVLRLLAQGLSTREVARALCYSERTIKNVLYELTTRHGLRNRTHAVAVAVRAGVV